MLSQKLVLSIAALVVATVAGIVIGQTAIGQEEPEPAPTSDELTPQIDNSAFHERAGQRNADGSCRFEPVIFATLSDVPIADRFPGVPADQLPKIEIPEGAFETTEGKTIMSRRASVDTASCTEILEVGYPDISLGDQEYDLSKTLAPTVVNADGTVVEGVGEGAANEAPNGRRP
ncbi:MAG: hypothetical protein J4N26_01680 [Chloroflexi bacterium]|nr:hypothetical protein [Chloroflexota bacterium]